jgi:tungstate transport system permease protein
MRQRMDTFSQAIHAAVRLILTPDADLVSAIATSLSVSATATVIACLIGAPLGAWIAMRAFRGRPAVIIVVNALLGLPSVVVGLVVYLLLSRDGPLGWLGWLFTIKGMIMAQTALTLPIVVALAHRATQTYWRDYGDALSMDGATPGRCVITLLTMARWSMATVAMAAFGRAIAEVGAIMIVGGNIRDHTRTMTTAIALETSKGDLALAMGLGIVLVALMLLVSAVTLAFGQRQDVG